MSAPIRSNTARNISYEIPPHSKTLFGGNVCSNISHEGTREKQPNIIFILADDLGWGDLGILYQNTRSDRKSVV